MKFFVAFFLLSNSLTSGQEIHFVKEDITFHLSRESFVVDGYYWFYNPSRVLTERLIYYPFPVVGKSSAVDSVDIFDITDGTQPKISDRTETGLSFVLALTGHDTALYHIAYRQKICDDSAVYILRSTQAWNRPLEYAEYKLVIEDSTVVTGFSYEPVKRYDIEGKQIFLWRRTDFMPDRDFVVHFRSR
jgi:hypothetical protein